MRLVGNNSHQNVTLLFSVYNTLARKLPGKGIQVSLAFSGGYKTALSMFFGSYASLPADSHNAGGKEAQFSVSPQKLSMGALP